MGVVQDQKGTIVVVDDEPISPTSSISTSLAKAFGC
jgi:hypothetical protein